MSNLKPLAFGKSSGRRRESVLEMRDAISGLLVNINGVGLKKLGLRLGNLFH